DRLAGKGGVSNAAAWLAAAIDGESLADPALAAIAERAGELYASIGDVATAVPLLRRAHDAGPAAVRLLPRIDELLRQSGTPAERLALHREALDRAAEPARKRELRHAIAALERSELGDVDAAVVTLRACLAEDPGDSAAEGALLDLLAASGR